jgi:sulfur carrier protein ThiS
MRVTVKLGSVLRGKAPRDFTGGEGQLCLEAGATVAEAMKALGIEPEEVNLVYRNHRLVLPEAELAEGDRLALFPPNFIHFHQFYLKRGG